VRSIRIINIDLKPFLVKPTIAASKVWADAPSYSYYVAIAPFVVAVAVAATSARAVRCRC
jgi:hypothetical protein